MPGSIISLCFGAGITVRLSIQELTTLYWGCRTIEVLQRFDYTEWHHQARYLRRRRRWAGSLGGDETGKERNQKRALRINDTRLRAWSIVLPMGEKKRKYTAWKPVSNKESGFREHITNGEWDMAKSCRLDVVRKSHCLDTCPSIPCWFDWFGLTRRSCWDGGRGRRIKFSSLISTKKTRPNIQGCAVTCAANMARCRKRGPIDCAPSI